LNAKHYSAKERKVVDTGWTSGGYKLSPPAGCCHATKVLVSLASGCNLSGGNSWAVICCFFASDIDYAYQKATDFFEGSLGIVALLPAIWNILPREIDIEEIICKNKK
jgi:hypothetical protein